MARILDSHGISGNICKVVETSKGYILNGHYYKKDTLTPVPFKTIPVKSTREYMFLNKQQILHDDSINYDFHVDSERVIQDINDPTITYIITFIGNELTCKKIREVNGTVEILGEYNIGWSEIWESVYLKGSKIHQFVGQNEKYIFFSVQCWDNRFSGSISKIAYVDKHNLIMRLIKMGNDRPTKLYGIYETDEYIYYGRETGFNSSYLYRMSKSTHAVDNIRILHRTGKFEGHMGFTKGYITDPVSAPNIITFYHMNWDNDNDLYYFVKYNLDLDNTDLATMCTESEIPVVWDDTIANEIPNLGYNNQWVRQELFVSEIEGTKYLNLVRFVNANVNVATNNTQNGVWTFIIRDTSLELTAFTQFSEGSIAKAVLLSSDKKFMAVGTTNNVIFLNFDEIDGAYKITEILDMIPYSIGLDMSDNVWVLKSNYEVEMISTTIPTEINITFAENSYKYEGVDINTTISIDARNYQGDYLDINLDLTIDGNAIFTANSSKNTREITSNKGKIDIPVTITGHGNITIYPKYVTKTI